VLTRLVLIPSSLATLLAFMLAMLPGEAPPGDVPRFVDVTAASGIKFVNICGEADRKDYIFEAKGGGVGALDFDNDGWMDIVFAQGSTRCPRSTATAATAHSRTSRSRPG
jgi:hypothetical protein